MRARKLKYPKEGEDWGEAQLDNGRGEQEARERGKFLYTEEGGGGEQKCQKRQSKLAPMRGVEWEARVVLMGLIGVAVDRVEQRKRLEVELWTEDSSQWEEWLNLQHEVWGESADAKMMCLKDESGALHARAVTFIDEEDPGGALHDSAVIYKALCGPADAKVKSLALELEPGALHERVGMKNVQDYNMNTQDDRNVLEIDYDRGALHGRAGIVLCVKQDADGSGAGVLCNVRQVKNMNLEASKQKTAPSIPEDRQSCILDNKWKTTIGDDTAKKITFTTLFKQAVFKEQQPRSKKQKFGFNSPGTPGLKIKMKTIGELFGKASVKRKIEMFDNLGSPKIKQQRNYVRKSERTAKVLFSDTNGAND